LRYQLLLRSVGFGWSYELEFLIGCGVTISRFYEVGSRDSNEVQWQAGKKNGREPYLLAGSEDRLLTYRKPFLMVVILRPWDAKVNRCHTLSDCRITPGGDKAGEEQLFNRRSICLC
jgi:hypothetical protein